MVGGVSSLVVGVCSRRCRHREREREREMLASTMAHASDWLLAPPIPGLGLALGSDCFRTAVKFRLGMPLFSEPFPCTVTSSGVL